MVEKVLVFQQVVVDLLLAAGEVHVRWLIREL
jgi:hypothetical protein